MNQNIAESIMVAVLDDMVDSSLPRLLAMREKLENGELLGKSELEFCREMIEKVNICQRDNADDPECSEIFADFAHLLFTVSQLALKNEQDCGSPALR